MFYKLFMKLPHLQYFAADGGNGGGDQAPTQPNNANSNPGGQQPNNNEPTQSQTPSQPQNQPGTGEQPPGEEKVFKQEDVNNIVARETKKAQEKLLKQLGLEEDFQNAKEGIQKYKEWVESQKTEQEKQQEKLQTLESENGTLAEENNNLKTQLAALKAGVNAESVEDVVILAQKYVSDEVDIDKAIQQVLEKYPQFKAQTQQEPQQQDEPPKPQFMTGQHQKQPQSEMEKWLEAFK